MATSSKIQTDENFEILVEHQQGDDIWTFPPELLVKLPDYNPDTVKKINTYQKKFVEVSSAGKLTRDLIDEKMQRLIGKEMITEAKKLNNQIALHKDVYLYRNWVLDTYIPIWKTPPTSNTISKIYLTKKIKEKTLVRDYKIFYIFDNKKYEFTDAGFIYRIPGTLTGKTLKLNLGVQPDSGPNIIQKLQSLKIFLRSSSIVDHMVNAKAKDLRLIGSRLHHNNLIEKLKLHHLPGNPTMITAIEIMTYKVEVNLTDNFAFFTDANSSRYWFNKDKFILEVSPGQLSRSKVLSNYKRVNTQKLNDFEYNLRRVDQPIDAHIIEHLGETLLHTYLHGNYQIIGFKKYHDKHDTSKILAMEIKTKKLSFLERIKKPSKLPKSPTLPVLRRRQEGLHNKGPKGEELLRQHDLQRTRALQARAARVSAPLSPAPRSHATPSPATPSNDTQSLRQRENSYANPTLVPWDGGNYKKIIKGRPKTKRTRRIKRRRGKKPSKKRYYLRSKART